MLMNNRHLSEETDRLQEKMVNIEIWIHVEGQKDVKAEEQRREEGSGK